MLWLATGLRAIVWLTRPEEAIRQVPLPDSSQAEPAADIQELLGAGLCAEHDGLPSDGSMASLHGAVVDEALALDGQEVGSGRWAVEPQALDPP